MFINNFNILKTKKKNGKCKLSIKKQDNFFDKITINNRNGIVNML